MDVKRINEEIENLLNETQIEYVDEVAAIKEGVYEGDKIAEVVLSNIDEFNENELIEILENYHYYMICGGHALFPSGWRSEFGPYPAKLAYALSKSRENEDITDIFNIFYRSHGDLETWNDAALVWQEQILDNFDKFKNSVSNVEEEGYDNYLEDMLVDIEEAYPKFVEIVRDRMNK